MVTATSFLILGWVLVLVGTETIEGSGQSQLITREQVESFLFLSLSQDSPRTPLQVSLQLDLVHAANHFSRGQIGLTIWLTQKWVDPSMQFDPFYEDEPSDEQTNILTFPIDSPHFEHLQRPDTVVKNAHYYKRIASPNPHGFIALFANGTVIQSEKIVVDLPCRLMLKPIGNPRTHRTNHQWMDVCVLKFGSYVRSRRLLSLTWDSDSAVKKSTVPCSPTNGKLQAPSCSLKQTTTYLRTKMQLNQPYDELVAEFRFVRL